MYSFVSAYFHAEQSLLVLGGLGLSLLPKRNLAMK
jgi:hypothetical protein